jgi:shikimate dehydrogenase
MARCGENTDWIGFSWLVERAFGSIAGASVAQIGTGGAGSATALALGNAVRQVVLFDPDAARAQRLAAQPVTAWSPAALPWRVMSARDCPMRGRGQRNARGHGQIARRAV